MRLLALMPRETASVSFIWVRGLGPHSALPLRSRRVGRGFRGGCVVGAHPEIRDQSGGEQGFGIAFAHSLSRGSGEGSGAYVAILSRCDAGKLPSLKDPSDRRCSATSGRS